MGSESVRRDSFETSEKSRSKDRMTAAAAVRYRLVASAGEERSRASGFHLLQIPIAFLWREYGPHVACQATGVAAIGDNENMFCLNDPDAASDVISHDPVGGVVRLRVRRQPVGFIRLLIELTVTGIVDEQFLVFMERGAITIQGR